MKQTAPPSVGGPCPTSQRPECTSKLLLSPQRESASCLTLQWTGTLASPSAFDLGPKAIPSAVFGLQLATCRSCICQLSQLQVDQFLIQNLSVCVYVSVSLYRACSCWASGFPLIVNIDNFQKGKGKLNVCLICQMYKCVCECMYVYFFFLCLSGARTDISAWPRSRHVSIFVRSAAIRLQLLSEP